MKGILFLLMLLLCSPGQAAEAVVGMNERVLRAIESAQLLLDAEDYAGAESELLELSERRLSGYERAQLSNLLGFVYWQQEKWDLAEQTYEVGLAQRGLPDSLRGMLTATLARLALINENYTLAEARLHELLLIPKQDTPEHRMLLATTYVGAERWEDALVAAEAAIADRSAAGLAPIENWLLLLGSIHYSLDNPEAMREVITEVALLWPREKHLMNLAALHGQLGETERQLALVESMIDHGRVVQEKNLLLLSGLFLAHGLPYKAAVLLETNLDKGLIEPDQRQLERLSQAWFMAAEPLKAIPPLARAAELSEDGELYMRVARLYLDDHQWQAADKAAASAIERGGLGDKEGDAWLLRGMAMAGLEQYTSALVHFERALASESSVTYAKQWMQYVQSERERAEMLALDSTGE